MALGWAGVWRIQLLFCLISHNGGWLLQASKKDLLQLDFESALKYFRVILPRKYRTEANAKDLIQQAVKLKVHRNARSSNSREILL